MVLNFKNFLNESVEPPEFEIGDEVIFGVLNRGQRKQASYSR